VSKTKEFVFMCEHMGGTTWTVEYQWAIEGEAEEIVRCRDCKYYDADDMECRENGIRPEPDGFCAWGERMES